MTDQSIPLGVLLPTVGETRPNRILSWLLADKRGNGKGRSMLSERTWRKGKNFKNLHK